MTPAFVIAILLCAGDNCEAVQAEPGISYPSIELCRDALSAKAPALDKAVAQRKDTRRATAICLQQASQPITEVENAYDVLETAIVHAEPKVEGAYVGVVESGQRTLVTGLVAGTSWVRVLLPDGTTGFVYGDHLRKLGSSAPAPSSSRAGTATAPPTSTAPSPSPSGRPSPAPSTQAPASASVPTQTSTPANAPARQPNSGEFRDCPTCPVMVLLPAGSFTMGSNDDASERPMHRVTIAPFAIGKFEVTAAEWSACAADGGCAYKPAQSEDKPESRPMMNLSWDDASQYVQWLGKTTGKAYRLPSEAEWEYAARAKTTTRYSWGEQLGVGNAGCDGCGGPHDPHNPASVSAFPANPWGLFGMEGGVAEWVEDCWHANYRAAPADGSPWRSANCSRHVLRGGSWKNPPADITVSSRNFYDSSVRYIANGVRVVLGQP